MSKTKQIGLVTIDASMPLHNVMHEKFVQTFVLGDSKGNATDAYLAVYAVDGSRKNHRDTASAAASRLLKNVIVLKRINYLITHELGFNNEDVDKQLSFLISQQNDMKVKLGAIKEYNAMKGRVTRKLDVTFNDASDEQLEQELTAIEAELKKADQIQAISRSEREKTIQGLPDLTDQQRDKLRTGELLP